MNIFFYIITILCHVTAFAQQNYFNNLYSNDSVGIISVAGIVLSDGYITVGDMGGYNGYSATYVRKIDLLGNEEWSKVLDGGVQYSSIIKGNALVKTLDGNYIVSDAQGLDSSSPDLRLIKFNGQGDTLWKRTYHTPNYLDGNAQVIQSSDGGLLLAGMHYYYIPDDTVGAARFYVIKTNAAGVKQWEAEYGLNCSLAFANATSDGGYILSGYRDYPPYNYDMYVVKIDSVGNLQWDRNYGTPEDDGGCQVIEYAPKQYALFGLWNSLLPSNKKYFYYTRLDSVGNTVGAAMTYERNGIYSPEAVYMTPQRDFIVGMVTCCPTAPEACSLAKFNLLGERLWEVPIESGVYDNDYLRDIEPTPDGGYLLVGFNYTPMADSWVIKVDSLGHTCGIANCDSTAVIDALPAPPPPPKTAQLNIMPNPAQEFVTLSWEATLNAKAELLVYDYTGKIVLRRFVSGNTANINVDYLPNGIYICQITDKGVMVASGKVTIVK